MRKACLLLAALAAVPAPAGTLTVAGGLKGSSDLVRRGATIYDSPQLAPILYVGLFDEQVQFLVGSVEYVRFLHEKVLRGRARLATVGDKPTFVNGGHPLGRANSREGSFEWMGTLELFIPDQDAQWLGVDLRLAQDLKAHGGQYAELTPRLTLYKAFFEKGKPLFQPQLFATLGFGSGSHNRYQFGASGEGGLTHVAYGLSLIIPARIDSAYPVFQLYRYDVIGAGNRAGDRLQGVRGSWHAEVEIVFGFYRSK